MLKKLPSVDPMRTRDHVNPLATRYVGAGKLQWIADDETSLDRLTENFSHTRQAQIVGVHGSGKSTLLEHLVPQLGSVVYRHDVVGQPFGNFAPWRMSPNSIVWYCLRKSNPVLKSFLSFLDQPNFVGILVVDGFEQLNWLQRGRVKRWILACNAGLLVTSHRDVGLPMLCQTSVSEQLAEQLFRQAFFNATGQVDLPACVQRLPWEQLLTKHRGNLRECFMELYDRIEDLNREASRIGC